jgi:hypothetical protein
MTDKKKLKKAIRARASKHGLSYSEARRSMVAPTPPSRPKCRAPDCDADADVEVFLHDEYVGYPDGTIFHERDFTCPFLCDAHKQENELKAEGERRPRGMVCYPYTNRHLAQGWSMYRPL